MTAQEKTFHLAVLLFGLGVVSLGFYTFTISPILDFLVSVGAIYLGFWLVIFSIKNLKNLH